MKKLASYVAGAVLASFCVMSAAQDNYPSKPVRVVIPFPPGGAVDTLMRTIGPELGSQLGQPIVIENKPGGGAQIGASVITTSPADGYSIFVAEVGAFGINPSLYKKIQYQPTRDFDGVALLVRTPMVMYGSPTGKINSFKILKDAMSTGTNVSYGSFGPGTAPHILGHLLATSDSKSNFTHVPYKGAPPAFQAIMSNEIDLLFDGVPGTLNMIKGNKAVPFAVVSAQRSEFLPNIPTTAELGYPSMQMDLWIGAAVKKGTPVNIINRLNAAFEKVMTQPEMWKRFADFGYSRTPMSPAQFDAFIKSEIDRYRPIIQATGAVVD